MSSRLGQQIRNVLRSFRGTAMNVPVISKSKRRVIENTIIESDEDAVSTGTVTIDSGVTVTIEDGGIWKIQ